MLKYHVVSALLASSVLVVVACGSAVDPAGGDQNLTGSSSGDGTSSGFVSSSGGPGASSGAPACVGLQCNQVACAGGGTTSLSGRVYDPSGTVPLYNAIVYVPNAPLEPFPNKLTCDQCGTVASGSPVTTALTDSKTTSP